MKIARLLLRMLFYSLVFGLLLSRAMSAVISHDENQFVAAGEFLGNHGLLPYRDFPYTHMPYAVLLYALAARISPYAYLTGRILGTLTWFACIILVVLISRLAARDYLRDMPPFVALLVEFLLVWVFFYHPLSFYVLGAALNHSYATLFALLSLLLLLRALHGMSSVPWAAFGSGAFIAISGLVRFNYASLSIVLLASWLIYAAVLRSPRDFGPVGAFLLGAFVACLPAFLLAALAPAAFYYGNIVYIRLNTVYYEGIHFRLNMDLASKTATFLSGLAYNPLDLVLYSTLLLVGISALVGFVKTRSPRHFAALCVTASAATLFLTAFSPTPTQAHYFFAPLPFILVLAAVLAFWTFQRSRLAAAVLLCALLLSFLAVVKLPNPLDQLGELLHPGEWTPIQVHDFAESLKTDVPQGRILALLSMVPMEAGYDAYPFTATGPFSWRTSLLLTPDRRAHYGVTSPDELPALLDATPPAAILTGFEAPNAGFEQGDLGGLETPFAEYARQHGYKPLSLSPAFLEHSLTLWLGPSR